jgi:hypothetical protein
MFRCAPNEGRIDSCDFARYNMPEVYKKRAQVPCFRAKLGFKNWLTMTRDGYLGPNRNKHLQASTFIYIV